MEEYIVTQIVLPSATGCNHIHIYLSDGSMYQYHMSDFIAAKTIEGDPVYDFLYKKVQELKLMKRSDVKKQLEGITIVK